MPKASQFYLLPDPCRDHVGDDELLRLVCVSFSTLDAVSNSPGTAHHFLLHLAHLCFHHARVNRFALGKFSGRAHPWPLRLLQQRGSAEVRTAPSTSLSVELQACQHDPQVQQ